MSDLLEPPFRPVGEPPPVWVGCQSYREGHNAHFVQVNRAFRCLSEAWVRVVVLGVIGDVVTLAVDDELHRYRNHNTRLLDADVRAVGAEALLNLEYRTLCLRPRDGGGMRVFSVRDADRPALPCRCGPADRPLST